jgi:predicted  nucleic acid-binding Zn-ribbon protein
VSGVSHGDEGRALICVICGAQWDDGTGQSLFSCFCPVCGANMVRELRQDAEADPEHPWW